MRRRPPVPEWASAQCFLQNTEERVTIIYRSPLFGRFVTSWEGLTPSQTTPVQDFFSQRLDPLARPTFRQGRNLGVSLGHFLELFRKKPAQGAEQFRVRVRFR